MYAEIVSDTEYLIQNVQTGYYFAGGRDWGTHGTLLAKPQFFTFIANGTGYSLDSRQYNNNASKHFLGTTLYVDNDATAWNVVETSTPGVYTIENGGNYLAGNGFNENIKTVTDANDAAAQWKLVSKADAIAAAGEGTLENPSNATALIKNPELKRNASTSFYSTWTITNFAGDNNPGNFAQGSSGNVANCAESYMSNNGFKATQTITEGVKAGVYRLDAQGFYQQRGTNANVPSIYLNDQSAVLPFNSANSGSMAGAYTDMLANRWPTEPLYVRVEDGGSLTITVSSDVSSCWTIFGEMSLTYYGDCTVAEAQNVGIVKEWKAYVAAKDGVIATLDADGQTSYNTAKAAIENPTSSEALATAKTALDAAVRAAVLAQTTPGTDMTLAIVNPSFESGNMDGWTNNSAAGMWTMMTRANAADPKVGDYWIEKYGVAGKLDISQTLEGLHPGYYNISVLTLDQDSKVKLIANDQEVAIVGGEKARYDLGIKLNTTSDLKIGLYCESHGGNKWVGADDFTLTYVSSDYPAVALTNGLLYNTDLETAQTTAKSEFEANPSNDTYNALVAAAAAAKAEKDYETAQVARTTAALANNTIATNVMDGWRCTNAQTFHVNTWSTEGNTDGSDMTTPFIENWVAAGGLLGNGEISYLMVGLTPGEKYNFSALGRAIIENNKDATLTGIKMFANETEVDLTTQGTATNDGKNSLVYGTFTLEGTVDANGVLAIGFKISETNCNWLSFKNVKFGKLIDIKKAELKDALDAIVIPTANIGNSAFQYSATALAPIISAKTVAQGVYDNPSATIAQIEEQIAAVQTLQLPALNEPAVGQKFNVVLTYDGYEFDNKAMTYIAGGRNDMGNYNIQYLVEANANYAQSFTMTQVEGNRYKMSQTDNDGVERYVSTGVPYTGGNTSQIRTTTNAAQALVVEVIPTSKEGVYNLKNTEANQYIGSQDAGVYTVNSHIDFNIVEASKATATLKITDAQYGTFIAPFNTEKPEGVTLYTCADVVDDVLTLETADAIEANTPYIVYSESVVDEDLEGWGLAKAATGKEGVLTGVYAATDAPVGSYVLQNLNDKVAFYLVAEGKQPSVGANRAYLTVPAAEGRVRAFYFDNNANAIEAISAIANNAIEAIYNANGVKVNALQKGINVVKMQNGKTQKVLVK